MRIDRVKYTKNPATNDEWIGMEAHLEPNENPEEVLSEISNRIDGWHNNKNAQFQSLLQQANQEEIDLMYLQFKNVLKTIEYRDEAEYYLSESPYYDVMELKMIAKNKPSKNDNE